MHTGRKSAAVLAICALTLVGCGGQAPQAGPTPGPTTASPAPSRTATSTTATPTAAPTASASATPSAEPEPEPTPSPTSSPSAIGTAPFRFALLTLDDLPSGWRKAPVEADSNAKIQPASCRAVLRPQVGLPKVTTATAGFQRGEDGPLLSHTVVSSKDDLVGYVDRLRATLPACRRFTAISADGFTTKYETKLTSFPKQGDATVSFRTTGRIDGSDVRIGANLVVVAKGTAMTALGAAGFDDQPDDVRLEPLLAKVLAKAE